MVAAKAQVDVDERRWLLRPELEYTDGVDSWNVRRDPQSDAPVVAVLRSGEYFTLLSGSEGDAWVQVRLDSGITGWSCQKKFGEVEALTPARARHQLDAQQAATSPKHRPSFAVDTAEMVEPGAEVPMASPAPPQLRRRISTHHLVGELRERRQAFDEAANAGDDVVRAKAAAEVQSTMAKLELLGIPNDELLNLEGADALLHTDAVVNSLLGELERRKSFIHSDFENPAAETCWLSTFFQSLWHSRVFHASFDRLVRPLPPLAEDSALGALRETWERYEQAMGAPHRLVSVRALAHAWGGGRGDCADAFGKLQSCSGDLETLAELFCMVPVPFLGRVPSVDELWAQVLEQGAQDAPLLALDLALPPCVNTSAVLRLALAMVPAERRPVEVADIGTEHRLCAVVCYIESLAHYVVFCRCISDPDRWLFFNDLSESVAVGAQRELKGWAAVAHECARFELCPRLLLYESPAAAERAIKTRGLKYYFSVVRRHVSPSGGLLGGRGGLLLNVFVHLLLVIGIAFMTRMLFFT